MSYKFTSLEELYNDWKKRATQAIEEVAVPVMKQLMLDSIETEVYGKYSPDEYIRRKEKGGLLDENNIEYKITFNGTDVLIEMFNNTTGNKAYRGSTDDFIDLIIATGEGYTWRNSRIYKNPIERDFYEVAQNMLNDPAIRSNIIAKLQAKGLDIK